MASPADEGTFAFHTTLSVRFNETDLQGHVNFMWYAAYFDVAVAGYFRAIGYGYPDMLDGGIDLYYVGTGTQMHARAYYEDVLNVHARVARIGNSSLRFAFAIRKAASDELVASGYIDAVCVHLEDKRPVRVPDEFRQAVRRFEDTPPRE